MRAVLTNPRRSRIALVTIATAILATSACSAKADENAVPPEQRTVGTCLATDQTPTKIADAAQRHAVDCSQTHTGLIYGRTDLDAPLGSASRATIAKTIDTICAPTVMAKALHLTPDSMALTRFEAIYSTGISELDESKTRVACIALLRDGEYGQALPADPATIPTAAPATYQACFPTRKLGAPTDCTINTSKFVLIAAPMLTGTTRPPAGTALKTVTAACTTAVKASSTNPSVKPIVAIPSEKQWEQGQHRGSCVIPHASWKSKATQTPSPTPSAS